MKARDIIPGWPRGKSTSPGPDLRVSPYWTRIWVHCYPSPYDLAMLEDQLDSDRRYHEAQQRMVDEWRKGIVKDEFGSPWHRSDFDIVRKTWADFGILWRMRSTARRSEGDD